MYTYVHIYMFFILLYIYIYIYIHVYIHIHICNTVRSAWALRKKVARRQPQKSLMPESGRKSSPIPIEDSTTKRWLCLGQGLA